MVEDPHEAKGSGGVAAAGKLFSAAAKRRKVCSRAGAVFEEHRFALCEAHYIFHCVGNGLYETGRGLGVFITVFADRWRLLVFVPMEVVLSSVHAIDIEQANVKPDRRIKCPVLVHTQPGQFVIKILGVFVAGEVAISLAAVGYCSADAVNELLDGVFTFAGFVVAIEVLAGNDLCGQLAPCNGYFNVLLFEDDLAVVAGDLSLTVFPFDLVERMNIGGRKSPGDFQPFRTNRLRACPGLKSCCWFVLGCFQGPILSHFYTSVLSNEPNHLILYTAFSGKLLQYVVNCNEIHIIIIWD